MPQLKPTQVIDLLRKCSITHVCAGCPLAGVHKCDEELMKIAAEVIEELAAAVPRWISLSERLPDQELQEVREAYGLDGVEVIVMVEAANLSTVLEYNGESFVDKYGDPYRVVKWMPMQMYLALAPPWAQILPQPHPAAKYVNHDRRLQRTVMASGQLGATITRA